MRRRPVVLCRAQQLVSPGDEARRVVDPVERQVAAFAAGQQRLAARLLEVVQPLAVLALGDEALGRRVGQRIVLVTRDVLQGDGQVPGTGMVGDEYHALAG